MSEIHVITTGEYSDYRVVAVTADRAIAERMCELDSALSHGEWPLLTEMPSRVVRYSASISYRHEGGRWIRQYPVDEMYLHREVLWAFADDTDIPVCEIIGHADGEWGSEPGAAYPYRYADFSAAGSDEERVRKSVADRHAAWLAHQEGIS